MPRQLRRGCSRCGRRYGSRILKYAYNALYFGCGDAYGSLHLRVLNADVAAGHKRRNDTSEVCRVRGQVCRGGFGGNAFLNDTDGVLHLGDLRDHRSRVGGRQCNSRDRCGNTGGGGGFGKAGLDSAAVFSEKVVQNSSYRVEETTN